MSFRLKTVLGIALIEAVLLLILVLSSLHELRHLGEEQLQQRAQTTATLFATTSADAVLASDLASLESVVQEVLRNPGLVYARVRDRVRVLAEDGPRDALARPFAADSGFEHIDDGLFDATATIEIGGATYGQVEIGIEIEHLQMELARAKSTFSGIALSELALSALFSLALGSLLTMQLRSLTDGTRAVAEGRYGYQVPVRGRDEIAQAVSAFNDMSAGLANLMAENGRQRDDLLATSDLLTGLLDNLQAGILMTDHQGRLLHANRHLRSLFGLPDELQSVATIVDGMAASFAHPESARLRLDAIVANGEAVLNRRFELRDGRFIETDYVPLRSNGEVYAHLWNHREVTARVLAERQLRERRRQLDTVFDLSPDGFVYFDRNGLLTSVNAAFTQMTGLSAGQAAGTERHRFFVLLRAHCGITDIDDSEGFRVIRTTVPQPRVLACRERSLRDDTGQVTEHVMYFRDITYEREVDDIKSEFLSTAARELRGPLATLYGFTDSLLHHDHDEAQRREMLQTVHQQSAHLVRVLNDLLELARIEARAGKEFQIRYQPLLPAIRGALAELPAEDSQRLVTQLPDVLPAVPLDPAKLGRLLGNVIDNALRYSPGGSEVRVEVEADGEAVRIAVIDRGRGMAPEEAAAAFERFYRAPGTGAVAGSGLGLSVAKEIADVHGWSLAVASEPGSGTRVTLVIPAGSALAAAPGGMA